MTAGDIAQLITAIAVVGNMLLSWFTHSKMSDVQKATDGMKDALVATTEKAALAIGEAKGKKDLLVEQKLDRL